MNSLCKVGDLDNVVYRWLFAVSRLAGVWRVPFTKTVGHPRSIHPLSISDTHSLE